MVQSQWEHAIGIVFEGIREYLSDEEYNNIYRYIQKYITPSKPKMRGVCIQVIGSGTELQSPVKPDELEKIFREAVKKFVKEEERQKNICKKVSNIIEFFFK
ncbi:hypothetical protein [Candidatus Methanodesulfokora washburnensis]|jgi:DNA-directed RNA polymerase subunit F|uniref:Uncharacterized protein n=1 Tax=Candidatus Methanodesulfokora washburnensis TaxID=2478471 RepID=A0A3R9QU52_9CREN|nr:hypothetical protein [Candidatus Methanodesulfokores washburnensis]RSN71940.1 hypothetical protein D6D85_14870 [Candidatus Methanodesulfokores washburnensis]